LSIAFLLLALALPVVVMPMNVALYGFDGTRRRLRRLALQLVGAMGLLAAVSWAARSIGEVYAIVIVISGALMMSFMGRRDTATRADEVTIASVLATPRGRWIWLLVAADIAILVLIVTTSMGSLP
jgi:hypothetical protein